MVPSRNRSKKFAVPVIFVILSLACSLPSLRRSSPTPSLSVPGRVMPTATVVLLPPALVESRPLPGSEIALDASITLVFNQPMDRTSVEGALSGAPALTGKITWENDRTMTFTPDVPFLPGTDLRVTISPSARSQHGLTMSEPKHLSYRTAASLRVTQKLPLPEAREVAPDSAVVVVFNQPVVPLGAEASAPPAAFSLDPPAAGKGEWLNTSTFIFYPEPALTGGLLYTAQLNPDLKSSLGAPLEAPEPWSFTIAMPRLLSAEPAGDGASIRLDAPVRLTFNQAMDAENVMENFALLDAGGQRVPGTAAWNPENTEMVFTSSTLLKRATTYTTRLNAEAQNSAGIPLGEMFTVNWQTVPPLNVVPLNLGQSDKPVYEAVQLFVSAPLLSEAQEAYFSFDPPLANFGTFQDETGHILYLSGDFKADTDYTLQVSPDLADAWGARLGTPLSFSFHTAPLEPTLNFTVGSPFLFLTPGNRTIPSQAASLRNIRSFIGTVPLADFIQFLGPQGYAFQESYHPADERSWSMDLDVSTTQVQTVNLRVSPESDPLAPGLYFLRYEKKAFGYQGPFTLVVSNINLVFKINATEVFLWAVDLRSGEPVSGTPVTVYDSQGTPLSAGLTDEDGIYQAPIPVQRDLYQTFFAVLGQPGRDQFSLALSNWAEGISPAFFGIREERQPPGLRTYLYTDRPIYQPGQTVYFRAVARDAYNGLYTLPAQTSLLVEIYDGLGNLLSSPELPLSGFGTAHGEYRLAEEAEPGYYRLQSGEDSLSFQVAEYRKPEIDLQVSFADEQVQAGQELAASVSARYFFDAPAGNVPLRWALYRSSAWFSIPGYQAGVEDLGWLEAAVYPNLSGRLGDLVAEGEGVTDPRGVFALQVPAALEEEQAPGLQHYTLEVTLQDESGLPVSGRDTALVHPAAFYIGLRPDVWVGQAGVAAGFELITTDWEGNPSGDHALHAEFRKVTWTRQEPELLGAFPVFIPEYTPISSADLRTGEDGLARLSFTPPEPGTYQLQVSGGGALSQVTLWVGGDGQAVWPQLPNQRLRLTSDSNRPYQPGQTAQVFIPNPFGRAVPALVTIERATVLRYEVIQLSEQGTLLPIALSEADAPNVYVSVLLLNAPAGSSPDFRLGFLTLEVDPAQSLLHMELTQQPEVAGPGEAVSLEIQVTDFQGKPVQAEFSVAAVDAAVLALAEANALPIDEAFYGKQPIGTHTNLSLAAYANRLLYQAGGVGGGGEEGSPPAVRQDFLDTAFWNAEIVTDANGTASVTFTLPDNLTTWKILAKGLTADTRVGESETQVVATKDLLIRPVAPRFMAAGDHVLLAGIVQNNTPNDLFAEVTLQGTGFVLDEADAGAGTVTRLVSLPAGGRQRVEWWGTAGDVPSLDLTFSVQAGDLQDEFRLSGLPVLQFTAPQAFVTAGLLEDAGERVELVSLPASFDRRQAGPGELRLSLSTSLAAAALEALNVLEGLPSLYNEQDLSVNLPAVVMAQTVQSFGVTAPELQNRLDAALPERLNALLARQNEDGGWGWWFGGESDPLQSAYILFGLTQFQKAGISIPAETIRRAVDYLLSGLPAAAMLNEGWQLNRLAFEHFALQAAASGDLSAAQALFERRSLLSPWAQALLAFTLEGLDPGSPQAQTLLSDLQAGALVSGSGAHWEDQNAGWRNMTSTVSTTAMVAYVLAQREPASPVLLQALRFLMAARLPEGTWASSYETAWSLLAAAEFMRGTGELSGNFRFSATFNNLELATGEAGGDARLKPVTAFVPAAEMDPENPSALAIQRSTGTGRLYYTAVLDVHLPVEQAAPFNGGMTISRNYYRMGDPCLEESCPPVTGSMANQQVLAALTLVVPQDAYAVLVEDHIPAGSEILDTSLQTSRMGAPGWLEGTPEEPAGTPAAQFDPRHPFAAGWGWWYFQGPRIFSDHIAWSADFLPAGTYVLQYTLTALQPGEYRVLPASVRQVYFPDIQGSSAGTIFTIIP